MAQVGPKTGYKVVGMKDSRNIKELDGGTQRCYMCNGDGYKIRRSRPFEQGVVSFEECLSCGGTGRVPVNMM